MSAIKRIPQCAFAGVTLVFAATSTHATCWEAAGERYRIDPLLLYAIAKVESNLHLDARNVNRDGSCDIGLMQINSRNLTRLAVYGMMESTLEADPCAAVMTGAWILGEFVDRMGYGWQAVGAYNAGGAPAWEVLRVKYAMKVWRYYQDLVARRTQQHAAHGKHAMTTIAHRVVMDR
ncbi:hypothetical protein WK68_14770 [Burkholderia ubonensis]|uniref:lytic transglycosylase domain-containing protein n=1 Tax=Burkholderia ubonensis TaxID=101571 RepID=UPI000753279D|nr:lytic transglycosylase domain-containing protein [Burkholderia ubonensis]KVU38844.1 hypothetical protein WK68_14770 [Burkholderia ubonensis]